MNMLENVEHTWQEQTRQTAQAIRLRVFDFVMKNGGGYLSQACSAAELFATLYLKIMQLGPSIAPMIPLPYAGPPGPSNPHYQSGAGYNGAKTPEYDRFIFSPSHYALVQYAALVEVGRMSEAGLYQFNQDGSTVEMIGAEHSPGGEVTSGSLGQALSQAGGIAMARRFKSETGRVWVFMTDGEFQEGQVWEAVQALVHYRLDNVGVYVDVNSQQCDGAIDSVMTVEPLAAKLTAFGARVIEVDGHDVAALAAPAALSPDGRPLFVLSRSDSCRGIPKLSERKPFLHYLRFKNAQEQNEYQQLLEQMRNSYNQMFATKIQPPNCYVANQVSSETGINLNSGTIINQNVGVYFCATPNVAKDDLARLEVELCSLPAKFTGRANYVSYYTPNGALTKTVTVRGLATGNYGWRYRIVTSRGATSFWTSENNPDFSVTTLIEPSPRYNVATQVRSDTGVNMVSGAFIPLTVGVYFRVVLKLSENELARLEVELLPWPAKFTGRANYVSYYSVGGATVNTITVCGLRPNKYGWRYRIVTNRGVAGPWIDENNLNFIVQT